MTPPLSGHPPTEKHFICTGGCNGVSDKPGVCQAINCPKYGQELTECNCTDSNDEIHQEKK